MTTAGIVEDLVQYQIRRIGYIRATNRIDNAVAALVRRRLDWRYDMPEAERGKTNARAKAIVSAFYDGTEPKPDDVQIMAAMAGDLETYRQGREPFVKARSDVEKAMRKLAHQLPVWPWVESVRGFGDLALAVMVAEAGDLSGYPADEPKTTKRAVDALWKRFGLTPYNGQAASTWRRKGGLTADEWEKFGYAPKRNAESYAVLGDPLFRKQSMIEGPYRLVYDHEKARFLAAEKTKGHAHMHGLRCMRKALLEDLWRVWNGYAPKERPALGHGVDTNGQTLVTQSGTTERLNLDQPAFTEGRGGSTQVEAAERSVVGQYTATEGLTASTHDEIAERSALGQRTSTNGQSQSTQSRAAECVGSDRATDTGNGQECVTSTDAAPRLNLGQSRCTNGLTTPTQVEAAERSALGHREATNGLQSRTESGAAECADAGQSALTEGQIGSTRVNAPDRRKAA